MKHLWVVEMRCNKNWLPTAGSYTTRRDARREIKFDWEFNFPKDKFRIKKYVPAK